MGWAQGPLSFFVAEPHAWALLPAQGVPAVQPVSFQWDASGEFLVFVDRKAPSLSDLLTRSLENPASMGELVETLEVRTWRVGQLTTRLVRTFEMPLTMGEPAVRFGAKRSYISIELPNSALADPEPGSSFVILNAQNGQTVTVVKGAEFGMIHPTLPLLTFERRNQLPFIVDLRTKDEYQVPAPPPGISLVETFPTDTGFQVVAYSGTGDLHMRLDPTTMTWRATTAKEMNDIDRSVLRLDGVPFVPSGKGETPELKIWGHELKKLHELYFLPLKTVKAPTAERFGMKLPEYALLQQVTGQAVVAPTLTAVAYVHRGALLVSRIQPVQLDLVIQAQVAAARTEALSNARMAGLAIQMYIADNESLPPVNGWQAAVLPYVKDREILARFSYTGAGHDPNAGGLEKFELGFVSGPGGRAVVYGDGSARWIPDPK